MLPSWLSPLILSLTTLTSQVNVQYRYNKLLRVSHCLDLQARECCMVLSGIVDTAIGRDTIGTAVVNITNLLANDIAAIRAAGPAHLHLCTHHVTKSIQGPNDREIYFHYGWPNSHRVFIGTSYVKLPTNVPPDGKTSAWLTADAMLALVWGGGAWLSSRAKMAGVPGLKARRGIVSGRGGYGYIGRPPRWRFPDSVLMDGMEYNSLNTSALEYRSSSGVILVTAREGS